MRKARSPMLVTVFGIVTEVRLAHPEQKDGARIVAPPATETVVIVEYALGNNSGRANRPGIFMELILLQFLKAPAPMLVTLFGIST